MANAAAETLPLFRSPSPGVTTTAQVAPRAIAKPVVSRPAWDNDDVADQRYWTAYDHFMVEREARAMRREMVLALLAKAWAAFRPSPRA
jgi:hypothetical protein